MTNEEKRAKERADYAANPEYYREKALKYARDNKKKRAEYTARYRAAHPDKVAAYKKASKHKNAGYAKAARLRHPGKYKEMYARQNLRKYGLTVAGKKEMCFNQNGCCAICFNPFKDARDTHVDHCHSTGKVRGILCSHCNLILGHAKDNTDVFKSAIKYLGGNVVETIYLPDFNLN